MGSLNASPVGFARPETSAAAKGQDRPAILSLISKQSKTSLWKKKKETRSIHGKKNPPDDNTMVGTTGAPWTKEAAKPPAKNPVAEKKWTPKLSWTRSTRGRKPRTSCRNLGCQIW